MTMQRAYALLNVKEIGEGVDYFTVKGIATTPTADRMGDIVEPMGAQFKLPMPLLWQHDSAKPVGTVEFAKPSKTGIPFEARIPKVMEAGALKDRVDEAIQSIKYRLVAAVSIGFQPVADAIEALKDGGYRFQKWTWLELSLVTIPANAEATITSVKSLDRKTAPALGQSRFAVATTSHNTPGASGSQQTSITSPKGQTQMKTIAERIHDAENKRGANVAAMQNLMNAADAAGETLDAEKVVEYEGLKTEVKALDAHIVRLKEQESWQVQTATAVNVAVNTGTENNDATATTTKAASTDGKGVVVYGKSQLPKGTMFTRIAMCLAASKGDVTRAVAIANNQPGWKNETPFVENVLKNWDMVTRTATTVGSTTDATFASPLVQYTNAANEFVELLRPATIIGRLPVPLRRVPFNIRFAVQTSGVSVGWVGQGNAAPATQQAYTSTTIGFAKIAAIVAITKELAMFSSPAAESLIRNDLIAYAATFIDTQFIDPSVAAVANVSPASITNGITPIQSSAAPSTLTSIEADVSNLMDGLTANNVDTTGLVWVMTPSTAFRLSQIRTTNGPYAFQDVGINGGTWHGIPVVTSNSVPHSVSAGSIIVLFRPDDIFYADDGGVELDSSQEASVQMNTAPSNAASSLISLWQSGLLGIRLERVLNYQRRRDQSVTYLDNVHL